MTKSAQIYHSINPFSENYCRKRKPIFISYYKNEIPINAFMTKNDSKNKWESG